MDSANSESLQTSSGDNDDHNSRTQSISAFFNSNTPATGPPPYPPPPFFETLPYLNSNPNLPWASSPPSWTTSNPNPNSIDMFSNGLISTSTSSSFPPLHPYTYSSNSNDTFPALQPTIATASAPRNSKKRSRASRRPSTTVLTTDTSNFRAMVQEFTGIPAPPFPSSSFPHSRFDLFRSPALTNAMPQPSLPSYLIHPTFHSSSSTTSATTSNHQLPNVDFGLLAIQQPTLSNNPNPVRPTMQSISQFNRTVADLTGKKLDKEDATQVLNSGAACDQRLERSSNLNYLAPDLISNFSVDKGSESAPSKDEEGTLDPWTCSSD